MRFRSYALIATIAVALTANASSSEAAVFDFIDMAEVANFGEGPYPPGGVTIDGILLTASATFMGNPATPYLDGLLPPDDLPAGLGVCQELDADDECDPSDEDNVTTGESLTLTFDQLVQITEITFRNGLHLPVFADNALFGLQNGATDLGNFSLVPTFSPMGVVGTEFTLSFESAEDTIEHEFYISAISVQAAQPVPEPGTFALIGLGLLGLAAYRRRR